jgi:hypothetical protein
LAISTLRIIIIHQVAVVVLVHILIMMIYRAWAVPAAVAVVIDAVPVDDSEWEDYGERVNRKIIHLILIAATKILGEVVLEAPVLGGEGAAHSPR